ncbi:transglutaminase domain-containing protein [Tenacibaculum sp. HL-MS23]|uniref:transglutaminase domain-containing protein n=1 Tax=Tenacibaculum sp. HL-MS23 TaxID=3077734 RepID=UPI0028FC10F5|nr:transglutaminase domain-containing protein [Tenacibaculum sp. HL-MS23]WNW02961.1 transglutaminase domain-containing protein [Tenacibaculum sp. HL-MS23]
MKQLYFLFFLTFSSLYAQDFTSIDEKIKTYPKLITADKLANKITADFNSDQEKVRAVFSWLAFNIRYDLEEFYNPSQKKIGFRYRTENEKQAKIKAIKEAIVTKTLSSRSAVCEGYAQTFSKICSLLNIENEVIKGHVRNSSSDIGKINNRTNHAWNAVKLNNKWMYIDATWAAGSVTYGKWQRNFNNYYYNIPKEKYFFTHFPEGVLWQLRVKRMSLKEYFNQPIYSSYFLKNDYEVVTPTSGIVYRKPNKPVSLTLKNVKSNQSIYCGFRNSKYTKKPKVTFNKNTATISIIPPANSKEIYLIIDKEVVLEYLLK